MTRSILAGITSLAHGLSHYVVRGVAVIALVVVWSVAHIGTYTLSLAGVTGVVMGTMTTTADAGWRGRRWGGRRWGRGWRRRW